MVFQHQQVLLHFHEVEMDLNYLCKISLIYFHYMLIDEQINVQFVAQDKILSLSDVSFEIHFQTF